MIQFHFKKPKKNTKDDDYSVRRKVSKLVQSSIGQVLLTNASTCLIY